MARRGNTVTVRTSSIRIEFTFEKIRYQKTLRARDGTSLKPTIPNIKFANRLIAEINQKIALGCFDMAEYFPADGGQGAMTVGRQLDLWQGAQRVEASTLKGYESAVRFWKNAVYDTNRLDARLGDVLLAGLKLSQVMGVLALKPKLSGKTVNNYAAVLKAALDLAVADRTLDRNVCDSLARAKWQKEPPDPFTRDEAETIIAEMHRRHPGQVANLVEFWFFTGLRTSEASGLRWANVDKASKYVHISEALVRGEHKASTKTGVARDVQLNSRAFEAITRQRQHTEMANGYVWQDPRYEQAWIDERAFRRSYWEPLLRKCGIRYRRPYNMRHTYATMMLMAGVNPAFAAKQMGHSVEIFLSTYTKWIDGEQNNTEMGRIESALNTPVGGERKVGS